MGQRIVHQNGLNPREVVINSGVGHQNVCGAVSCGKNCVVKKSRAFQARV